jgi:hypothetical protein
VRQFVRPVRLRDRVPVPPARATAAAGVSVAVAGAAVLAWRFWPRRRPAASSEPPATRWDQFTSRVTGPLEGAQRVVQPTLSLRTAKKVRPSSAATRKSFFMGNHGIPPGK